MHLGYIIAIASVCGLVLGGIVLLVSKYVCDAWVKKEKNPETFLQFCVRNGYRDIDEQMKQVKENHSKQEGYLIYARWTDEELEIAKTHDKASVEWHESENAKKEKVSNGLWIYDGFVWVWKIILLVLIFIFGVCITTAPMQTIHAKQETIMYEEMQVIWESAIKNGEPLENIMATEKLVEYNSWLAKAKADKRVWGCASRYFYEDLDKLHPLVIER